MISNIEFDLTDSFARLPKYDQITFISECLEAMREVDAQQAMIENINFLDSDTLLQELKDRGNL